MFPTAAEPTAKQADVLALREAGWSYADIAQQLKTTPVAARARGKRARQTARLGVSCDALRKRVLRAA